MTKKVTTPEVTEQPIAENTQQMSDVDVATERRLVALYTLQLVDSEIDKIQIIRGELPQAIQDLEDEIAGLQTRISNFKENIAANRRKSHRREMGGTHRPLPSAPCACSPQSWGHRQG